MHINEGKDKLALFSTKYNVLLTPLPFQFYLSPQSLLHNFIIFPPQCVYSLLHNFCYFPSSSSSSSSLLLFSLLLLLLLIFIVFPPSPPPHFYCFPNWKSKLDILNEIPPQVNENPPHFIHEIKTIAYDLT